ncbi:transposase family protein [Acidovorax sp. K2F]|uniref:transposase family protein n=1 Tax=Acidovorax sp. K2F TaxID=2978125 RepID=UPI0021B12BBF|nr:transposase family protein [Acidovorax sp. K2F]MCT6721563.1 transposase family protein [Acidovorax sp. K2F]
MSEFQVIAGSPAPSPGLVLRVGEAGNRYLRLTHVFNDCVYVMWVGAPEGARYARRPMSMSLSELQKLAETTSSAWGKLVLPAALTNEPTKGSERSTQLETAWSLVEPLIQAFKRKTNLSRNSFTALIRQRAEETETSQTTLLRTILRYYYFGGTRLALLSLPPGVKPGQASYTASTDSNAPPPKRRGRQSALADELGRNEFIVGPEDIKDMEACFQRLLSKGPAFKTTAHEEYLAVEFRRRHPAIYARYIASEAPEPVTARQFRYYIDEHLRFTDELARNMRTHQRNPGYLGSVRAAGPGEIYEIDATGGRIHLVSDDDPPVQVGKPTIYLLIDRWSRFVVSVYLSLRSASYEEVRHALLIAFTSREARFKRLGVNVTDVRWPVGRMPAAICPDRGSDFMSDSMEQSVVNDLRIDLTPLPPLCPDGKAIVERLIREVKRRMAASGMEGVYADRPMDPRTKRTARKAEAGAVRTLAEAYRLLVDIIEDHNNRPHRTLRRRRVLTQAGVPPTPRDAYLWGLKNITALRSAPLSEDDYYRLLLSSDKASISNGVLSYKGRPYLPDNEQAVELARRSTGRAKAVVIRLDKTFPTEVMVPSDQGNWARFVMTEGTAKEIAGLSLDEEEALATRTSRLWARAEHEGRIARLTAKNEKRSPSRKGGSTAAKLPKADQMAVRAQETARMKTRLLGKPSAPNQENPQTEGPTATAGWARLEEEERLRNLALIRQHRNKR